MYKNLPEFYNISLRQSGYKLEHSRAAPETKKIAQDIINLAAQYDLKKARAFENIPFASNKKTAHNPSDPYFIAASTIGYEWSDPIAPPAIHKYNQGYRQTFSGIQYQWDENGYSLNPYIAYDKRPGRGILALWGPNQTVTNGVVALKNSLLHAYGIIRKDDKMHALSGGHTKDLKQNINNEVRNEVIYKSQTDEFFEEMFSGSITLSAEYNILAQARIKETIEEINHNRDQENLPPLTFREEQKVHRHVVTEKKLDMVRENDPNLLRQLNDRFASSEIIYTGPMVASKANRKNAWVETYLSWFEMNDDDWQSILQNCNNRYRMKAGDDAAHAAIYEISPDLIENASGSHGPYFAYLMAHYMLSKQDITADISRQGQEIRRCLELSL